MSEIILDSVIDRQCMASVQAYSTWCNNDNPWCRSGAYD